MSKPTWRCPDGTCECHPISDVDPELTRHRVVLFDDAAKRMSGARARVWHAGREVNRANPYADGDAILEVTLDPGVEHVLIEWSPQDTPMHPMLPFRISYYLVLGERLETRVERRLHNIGFCFFPSLEQNVHAFQRIYGPPGVPSTGRPEDIDQQLERYHDTGVLPSIDNPYELQAGAPGDGCARESLITEPFEVGVETGEHVPWRESDHMVIVDGRGRQVFREPLGAGRPDGSLRTFLWDSYEKSQRYTVKVRFAEWSYIMYQALDVYDHLSPATHSPPPIIPAQVFIEDAGTPE